MDLPLPRRQDRPYLVAGGHPRKAPAAGAHPPAWLVPGRPGSTPRRRGTIGAMTNPTTPTRERWLGPGVAGMAGTRAVIAVSVIPGLLAMAWVSSKATSTCSTVGLVHPEGARPQPTEMAFSPGDTSRLSAN